MASATLSGRQMPVVKVVVNGRRSLGLVDTGCACTMVSSREAVGPFWAMGLITLLLQVAGGEAPPPLTINNKDCEAVFVS